MSVTVPIASSGDLDRLLPKAKLVDRVGMSYPSIWRAWKAGKFPAPVQISAGRIAWRESEIRTWMDGLPSSTIAPKARGRKKAGER